MGGRGESSLWSDKRVLSRLRIHEPLSFDVMEVYAVFFLLGLFEWFIGKVIIQ